MGFQSSLSVALLILATLVSVCVGVPKLPNLNPTVRLELSSYSIEEDYKFITVSWSGVPKPTEQDAIVAYVPVGITDFTLTIPTRYIWVNAVPTWRTGKGSYKFKVLNQRFNTVFYYFYNVTAAAGGVADPLENNPPTGFLNTNVIAKSGVVKVNTQWSYQQHLSYTQTPGELWVQWTTGARLSSPAVFYGLSPNKLTGFAKGNDTTYYRGTMCGATANSTGYFFPGWFNRVLLMGLKPNTQYYYYVADSTAHLSGGKLPSKLSGKVLHFTTPPNPGASASVKFIAWADSGQATDDKSNEWEWSDYDQVVTTAQNTTQGVVAELTNVWQQDQAEQGASLNLTRRMAKELDGVTMLMHNGDISYARGSVTQWDVFMDQYKDSFSYVPYMTLPGNHERDHPNTGDRYWPLHAAYDSGGECGIAYELRFKMPHPAFGQQWYGFNYGPIHFLQITTEQDFSPGSPQWLYILADLAAVDRSVTPWVVVGMHRPIYTSSIYGHDFQSDINVANDLQTSLERVFFLYEVDMTWSGHVHLYERTCPVLLKTCLGYNEDGTSMAPIHMCMGHGGFEYTWFMNPTPPPYWDAVYLEHGYMRVEANATMLHITGISSNTGKVMDDFTLVKPKGWQPQGFTAKKRFLDFFISNYTVQSIWEYPGMSSRALWTTPLYTPVAQLLASNQTLINMILAHKPEFMVNINVGDTVENLASVFKYYYQEFKSPEFAATTPSKEVADAYLNGIIYPLLEFFFNNTAKAALDPKFDAGTVTKPKNRGAPGQKYNPIPGY